MLIRDRDTGVRDYERELEIQEEDRGSTTGRRTTRKTGGRSETRGGSRTSGPQTKKK